MKKTIANATALALVTATFLGQTPNVWISQTKDVPILDIFSPEIAQAAQGNVSVNLNGNLLAFSGVQPQLVDGRVLVPVRGVFESMGFDVSWDNPSKTTTLKKEGLTITSQVDMNYMTVNGTQKSLDVKAQIINGNLMLPLRAISEATGAQVNWDSSTSTVSINTNGSSTISTSSAQKEPSPGRPEVEDIYFDGYVINKVKLSNGVVLCKGDTKEIVESLLGEPDRDTCRNPYRTDDKYILEERNFWYDNMNLTLVYTNEGRLSSVSLRDSGDSFMGYTIGDPFSLDQELRSYEYWGSGYGYIWPRVRGAYKEKVIAPSGAVLDQTQIEYVLYGNATYTNESKPTNIRTIEVVFRHYTTL